MIIYDGIIYKLQSTGGISRYFSELIPAVQEMSEEVTVIAPTSSSRKPPAHLPYICNTYGSRLFERIRPAPVKSIVKKKSGSIFHSSYYRLPDDDTVRSVVTVHDMIHEIFRHDLAGKLFVLQKKVALEQATHIICISESTRRDLISFYPGLRTKPMTVIYHGVSSVFKRDPEISRSLDLIFVGSRSGYKDFDFALAVVKAMPGRHFHVVGGGPISRAELEKLNQSCPNRFSVYGAVSDRFLNDLYNRCTALIYPSRYEGFGIPPLEAMKVGCIPVCRAVTSLPEVLGSAGLKIGDEPPEQVADTIASLGGEKLCDLQALGMQRAREFSWASCARQTIDVYASILNHY